MLDGYTLGIARKSRIQSMNIYQHGFIPIGLYAFLDSHCYQIYCIHIWQTPRYSDQQILIQ